MKPDRDIDSALRALGAARPPAGMERRIHARLDHAGRRASMHLPIAAAVIAAGVLVSVITLSPSDNPQPADVPVQNVTRGTSPQNPSNTAVHEMERRILARPRGTFGAASAVHVPDTPIAIGPATAGRKNGLASHHTRLASGAEAHAPEGSLKAHQKILVSTSRSTAGPAAVPAAQPQVQ